MVPHEPLDLIEELRLRRWAREEYVPAAMRSPRWHPVVHDEMARRDRELEDERSSPPLMLLAGPHAFRQRSRFTPTEIASNGVAEE